MSDLLKRLRRQRLDGREARHYYLKTWFLEYRYWPVMDDYRMQRAVLFWHGHEGLRLLWLPVEHF